VQFRTAAMHFGFRIVKHLASGMENWMREKHFTRLTDFIGRTVPAVGNWADLDLGNKVVAHIDQNTCIHCELCYFACEDSRIIPSVGPPCHWPISTIRSWAMAAPRPS